MAIPLRYKPVQSQTWPLNIILIVAVMVGLGAYLPEPRLFTIAAAILWGMFVFALFAFVLIHVAAAKIRREKGGLPLEQDADRVTGWSLVQTAMFLLTGYILHREGYFWLPLEMWTMTVIGFFYIAPLCRSIAKYA